MGNTMIRFIFVALAALSFLSPASIADIDPSDTTGCDVYSTPPLDQICTSGTLDYYCTDTAYENYKACVDADPLIAAYAAVACDKAKKAARGQAYIDSLVAGCADGIQADCDQIAHATTFVNQLDAEAAAASADFLTASAFCRAEYIAAVEACCSEAKAMTVSYTPLDDGCTATAPIPAAPVCTGVLDWTCMANLEAAFTSDWNYGVGIPRHAACVLQQTVPGLEATVATHLAAVQAAASDIARWAPLCAAGDQVACLKEDAATDAWDDALADWVTAANALNTVNGLIFTKNSQALAEETSLLASFFTDAGGCCTPY